MFYNNNFIRENIEDVAFDVVSTFSLKTKAVNTEGPMLMLFTIDDLYMKGHALFDEQNNSNYGYLFPRGLLAEFIENLDELTAEIEEKNRPKALFIDYDMSFTSLPYGKELSKEDIRLLDVLKRERSYSIFLPKTDVYNFIENSNNEQIQQAIKDQKIVFVSVSFLQSSDGIVRRYQSYKEYVNKEGISERYEGVSIALWEKIKGNMISENQSKTYFYKDDIVANRITTKQYKSYLEEDGCSISKSYWDKFVKYSANCSLFDIIEEDYAESILMLGGSHRYNNDNFSINDIWSTDSFSGIEIHANTLMTLLHLNGPLQRLSLPVSLMLIFFLFFFFSFFISWILSGTDIVFSKKEFFISILFSTMILISISIYLLNEYNLWFNWLVPWVAFGFYELFLALQSWVPTHYIKWREK